MPSEYGLRPPDRGGDLEVLPPGEVRVERRLLDDRPDSRQRLRAARRHRQAEHAGAAGARSGEPEQHPDEGGLAGAVVA